MEPRFKDGTAAELIAVLQELPADARVYIDLEWTLRRVVNVDYTSEDNMVVIG